MSWLLTVIVVTGSIAAMTLAYPGGAPLSACSGLIPQHDSNASADNSAYSIKLERLAPNQLRVILSAAKVPFKGFIMASTDPSGKFTPEDTTSKLLNCKDQPTVTHTNSTAKFNVPVLWQRDPELGSVTFVATVVTGYNEDYVPEIKNAYTP
ncbi:putative defense protein 3 [Procambarus clarkii]|uniref:putative defense protein 3 n=1 Tax=Procambarus clarkii TaxID=6728 RepID=UPI001E6715DF|nr:putative defense protein 3 [Procambarus clarkii]